MNTYVIKYNTKQMSDYLTKGGIVQKEKDGSDTAIGQFENRAMPGTETTFAVRKEGSSNKPLTKIQQGILNKIVPMFGFIDEEKNEMITTADLNVGIGPFWNHPDLTFNIKNSSVEINVDEEDPLKEPKSYFWFKVMEADPMFFINDGKHTRPETMADVMFIVENKVTASKELKTKVNTLLDSTTVIRMVQKMSRDRKHFVIDEIGSNLYHKVDTSDADLEDIIIAQLDKDGERRVSNSMKFKEFVEAISVKSNETFDTISTVKKAAKEGVIKKSGDMYYFEKTSVGRSIKEAEDFFSSPLNEKQLTALKISLRGKK